MKKSLLSAVVCILLFPFSPFAQEYSYTHYGIAEGLAGSTVYCITQDKEGFIWAGTETGVSRFDGTHFKNFTTKDGLTDLEVVHIFGDSKGRVWMAPFRKSVCFYYQGKIHNEQNDSLLARIQLQGRVEGFAEDAGGNILLQEKRSLHIINKDGTLVRCDSLDHAPIQLCVAVSRSSSGHFLAAADAKIIEFDAKRCINSIKIPARVDLKPSNIAMCTGGAVWAGSDTRDDILSFSKKKIIHWSPDKWGVRHICFSMLDDSLVYSNGLSGSLEYNINTGQTRKYLRGTAVSRTFRDASGNLWFSTMGEGIFRLNSNEVKTITLTVQRTETSNVTAIARVGDEILVGDNHHCIFRLALPDLALKYPKPFLNYMARRILYIDTSTNGKVMIGGDLGLDEYTRSFRFTNSCPAGGLKSAVRISDREVLVASSWMAGILDIRDLTFTDTLWPERSTVVFYKEDTIYVGTLNGLYRSIKRAPLVSLGEGTPFLRKRISSIAESADGTLWIASYDDAGIIGYKNNRQVAAITHQQGLTSDICRTLLVHNNILWVGTDKGLNRIGLDKPGYHVTQYTSKDGLASDMINTVFVDSSRVYVGTSAGLSFFDEHKPAGSEGCRLYLLSLINSGRERIADTGHLVIPYTDKRIRLEFAGISYRSAGDISYRYRMVGLDSTWREAKENFLEYPDLPSGNYEWQLMAVNKFGEQSRLLRLPVEVSIQLWKKTWFVVMAWLLSLVLSWLLVSRRIAHIRGQHREKELLMQRMSELENTALKSQMNPHFIFNCLSSIQQFIFAGDTAGSNKYISGLARLIRMTLNNSSRSFVCIGDEVDYLSSYLALEKMRFKEKIDYEVVVDGAIDKDTVLIPPMLIQPHVENALLHGLAPRTHGPGASTGGKGFVSVKMAREADMLVVTVADNGVGRKAAFQKSIGPMAHSSKGMSLTEDRISTMNKLYGGAASIVITDLKDEAGAPAGTRVVITLPLFQEQSLYS